jgi:transcriptional regulator with XRE-family HTH domain
LGTELLRYRSESGLSLEEAAKRSGQSPSRLRRVESGTKGIHPREARRLLKQHGVHDHDAIVALLDMAQNSLRSQTWFEKVEIEEASDGNSMFGHLAEVWSFSIVYVETRPMSRTRWLRDPSVMAFADEDRLQLKSDLICSSKGQILPNAPSVGDDLRQLAEELSRARTAVDGQDSMALNAEPQSIETEVLALTFEGHFILSPSADAQQKSRRLQQLAFLLALARLRLRGLLEVGTRRTLESLAPIPFSRQVSPRDRMTSSGRSLRGPTSLHVSCIGRGMALAT